MAKFKDSRGKIHRGDIFLVKNVQYEDRIGYKDRPAVIDHVQGDKVYCRMCTSKFKGRPDHVRILDTIGAGLIGDTFVKPDISQCSVAALSHRIGKLTSFDFEAVFHA